MEIITQAVRVIDYENDRIQKRNVNEMPKFRDYIEQLIGHVSNNVSIREYHTQSTGTEVVAQILEIAQSPEDTGLIEEKIDAIAGRLIRKEQEAQERVGHMNIRVQKGSLLFVLFQENQSRKCILAKVEHTGFFDEADYSEKFGFSKDTKKIWKTCIFNLDDLNADQFQAKVYSDTVAKYWWHDFLELEECQNDATNTAKAYHDIYTVIYKWKDNIVYPITAGVVVGLIVALIVNLCGILFQTVRDKKSQFDVSAEMLTPIPAYTHDNKIAENENANTINLESTDTESMAVNSSFDMYVAGTVNGKRIPMYVAGTDDLEHVPTVRLSVTNRNDFSIDIKEITVRVLDYKSPDEFAIISPAGGDDERPVQQWKCDISTAEQEYLATYIGTTGDTDGDAGKRYVCVATGDTGEFNVAICSDIAGLYSVEVNLKYNFRGKTKTETTDEMQFIIR